MDQSTLKPEVTQLVKTTTTTMDSAKSIKATIQKLLMTPDSSLIGNGKLTNV